jgi:Tol biopolymer transport system component
MLMQKRISSVLVALSSLMILSVLVGCARIINDKSSSPIGGINTAITGTPTSIVLSLQAPDITPAPVLETGNISGWSVFSSIVHSDPPAGQIFLKNFDTGDVTQLTTSGNNSYPKWSPDGSQIMFLSWTKENPNVYIMNKDGSNQRPVMASSASESMADWSPDGSKIAFVSNKNGKYQIYVFDLMTQVAVQLTNNPEGAFSPNWSPDGKYIAFSSSTKGDGRSQIFIMNADGTNVRQMTSYVLGNFDGNPVWCPDASCVIFERNNGNLQLMLLDFTNKEVSPLLIGVFDTLRQEAGLGRSPIRGYITFSVDQKYYAMDMKSRGLYYLPIEKVFDLSFFP